MSLLSTDITKVKRLSLREVKLPAPELRVGPITLSQVEQPLTDEEIAYRRLVVINPALETLVESLDLIKPQPRTTSQGYNKPPQEPDIKIDSPKLIALATNILQVETNYKKEEIITRIKQATNVDQERAERGFNLMLKAGAIEQPINKEIYYLKGSTPF